LHVFNHKKGGIRRSAIAPHWIGKSRLQKYDTVDYNGINCFVFGSTHGRPVVRDIDGNSVSSSPYVKCSSVRFKMRKRDNLIVQTIKYI
jgi:hypothetical protein